MENQMTDLDSAPGWDFTPDETYNPRPHAFDCDCDHCMGEPEE